MTPSAWFAEPRLKEMLLAAAALSAQVSERMQSLGMQGGQFRIEVTAGDNDSLSAYGGDSIEFLVSANPGQPLKPLA